MKKNKHDHKGTKALKLSIFFTLMLAPFMAVLFKCCYVTFNKNAKDSYSNEMVTNTSIVNDNHLIANQNYMFNYNDESTTTSASPIYYYNSINIDWSDYTTYDNSQINGFNFYAANSGNKQRIKFWYDNNEVGYSNNIWGVDLKTLTINLNNVSNENQSAQPNFKLYVYSYTTMKLDNAFYYAIGEAMDSQYFAWARTSALYTATSGLTTGLGITTQAIPTLLVYWLILTTIYIVFDIVIESFVYLTHMITSRFE